MLKITNYKRSFLFGLLISSFFIEGSFSSPDHSSSDSDSESEKLALLRKHYTPDPKVESIPESQTSPETKTESSKAHKKGKEKTSFNMATGSDNSIKLSEGTGTSSKDKSQKKKNSRTTPPIPLAESEKPFQSNLAKPSKKKKGKMPVHKSSSGLSAGSSSESEEEDFPKQIQTQLEEYNNTKIIDVNPFSSKVDDPEAAERLYELALESGKEEYSLNEEGLIGKKLPGSRTIFLLMQAYQKGHEKSTDLLVKIIMQKVEVQVAKWKFGPLPSHEQKKTITAYDNLSRKKKEQFRMNLSQSVDQLLSVLNEETDRHLEQSRRLGEQYEKMVSDYEQFSKKNEAKGDEFLEAAYGGEGISLTDVEEKIKEIELIEQVLAAQKLALREYRKKAHGSIPHTKLAFFQKSVRNKFLKKFIGKIAIASGVADRKDNSLNYLIKGTRTAGTVGAGFIPFAGGAASVAVGVVGGGAEATYNIAKKRKIMQFVSSFLGNIEETEQLIHILDNILAPLVVNQLGERYENPISLHPPREKKIKKLADYTIKLMLRDFSSSKFPSSEDGRDGGFYETVADFLCDRVSYCTKAHVVKATDVGMGTAVIKNIKSYRLLTKSGAYDPQASIEERFYLKAFKTKTQDSKEKHDKKSKKCHKKVLKHGFRNENKILEHIHERNLQLFAESYTKKALKCIEKGRSKSQEDIIWENLEENRKKKIAKAFLEDMVSTTVETIPELINAAKG